MKMDAREAFRLRGIRKSAVDQVGQAVRDGVLPKQSSQLCMQRSAHAQLAARLESRGSGCTFHANRYDQAPRSGYGNGQGECQGRRSGASMTRKSPGPADV